EPWFLPSNAPIRSAESTCLWKTTSETRWCRAFCARPPSASAAPRRPGKRARRGRRPRRHLKRDSRSLRPSFSLRRRGRFFRLQVFAHLVVQLTQDLVHLLDQVSLLAIGFPFAQVFRP